MEARARRFRGAILFAALVAILVGLLASPADAAVKISFNPLAGELPEGLAFDHQGNAFVTLAPRGEVREVAPDGTQRTVAQVSPPGQGFGPLGLAFNRWGELFVAVATLDPQTGGVYEIAHDGTARRIPGSEQIGLPNGLAFGPDGSLFATDSLNGVIWRLDVGHHNGGGSTTPWLKDALLAGNGSLGLGVPLGANGIALRGRSLYVSVTEPGRIVRVPIAWDGRSGAPQVVAEGPQFVGADGIQFDVAGGLYIAVNGQNMLVRLAPDGGVTTIATAADGLDAPASPAFGTRWGDRRTLYVTNFAFGHANPADAHPGVLSFDVGIPGAPLPPSFARFFLSDLLQRGAPCGLDVRRAWPARWNN